MGDVEISVGEDKQSWGEHGEQRKSPCPLLPEDCERHRAAEQVKCSCWAVTADEDSFNTTLKTVFIVIINVVAIQILFFDTTVLWRLFQMAQWTVVFAALLATILGIGLFIQKIKQKPSSAPSKRELEAQTISGLIQQV